MTLACWMAPKTWLTAMALGCLAPVGVVAAPQPANLDEAKVPAYVLPDPLVDSAGRRVVDAAGWRARRAELLELATREMYGRSPLGRPEGMHFVVTAEDPRALGGRATRREVTVQFGRAADAPRLRLLVYLPNHVAGPRPAFVGLNFTGNHTTTDDPAVAVAEDAVYPETARARPRGKTLELKARGSESERWQVARVIDRGYATATAWYYDLCPDRVEGMEQNVAALAAAGATEGRAPDAWGAVAVWAWGLSRALDYLETEPRVDARRVLVHGHSRLGKAALWAAATDERFAGLIANNSGCGGAALSKRVLGETVGLINHRFPHWFSRSFRRYDDREADLPFDQHQVLALVAPRPLYVASAAEDLWADPKGEYLALAAAGPVYALLGQPSLGASPMPPVDQPIATTAMGYHVRTGKHDITAYDWDRFIDFADRALAR
jgi:hypothetical protein